VSGWGELIVGLVILSALVGVVLPILRVSCLISARSWCGRSSRECKRWTVFAVARPARYFGRREIQRGLVPRCVSGRPDPNPLSSRVCRHRPVFFVIPLIGLSSVHPGTYLSELQRVSNHDTAWRATLHATKAFGSRC